MGSPFAVQLFSVRDELAADRDGTLAAVAAMGYGSVEPCLPVDDVAAFRATLDDLGLSVCAVHASGLVRGGDPDEIFRAVVALGGDRVVIPSIRPEERFASAESLAQVAAEITALAEQAGRHGLMLGYHNHAFELEARIDDTPALLALADLVPTDVFFEIDVYWAELGGTDAPALLRELGERVPLIHVKDGPGLRGEPNVTLGDGVLDLPAVLAAAPDAVRIVEFGTWRGSIMDQLRASARVLAALEPVTS